MKTHGVLHGAITSFDTIQQVVIVSVATVNVLSHESHTSTIFAVELFRTGQFHCFPDVFSKKGGFDGKFQWSIKLQTYANIIIHSHTLLGEPVSVEGS